MIPVAPLAPAIDSLEAMIEFHKEHYRKASPVQRFANRAIDALGRPEAVVLVLVLTAGWIGFNRLAPRLGLHSLEAFPYPELEFFTAIVVFVVTFLILASQRHASELADKRSQLTLLIAIQNDKKCSKLIELMEEQRRANPLLVPRHDDEVTAMARATDLTEVVEQLDPPTF